MICQEVPMMQSLQLNFNAIAHKKPSFICKFAVQFADARNMILWQTDFSGGQAGSQDPL